MLKFTCLVFLVAVAVSWSHVDAKPNWGVGLDGGVPFKREAKTDKEEIFSFDEFLAELDDLSAESERQFAKDFFVALLLLTVDLNNSAEASRVQSVFKEVSDKDWEHVDNYAVELLKMYQEIIGKKPVARKAF